MPAGRRRQVTNPRSEPIRSGKRETEGKRKGQESEKVQGKWIKMSEHEDVGVNIAATTPASKQGMGSKSSNRLNLDKVSKGGRSSKAHAVVPPTGPRDPSRNKRKPFDEVEAYRKETKNMSRSLNG